MDGTLIDSEPLWLKSEIEIMAEVGCHWDEQDQINCLGGPAERTELYMQERSKNVKPYGYFINRLHEVMKTKIANELELIPNALELLKECKDLGIQTAFHHTYVREMQMVLALSEILVHAVLLQAELLLHLQ